MNPFIWLFILPLFLLFFYFKRNTLKPFSQHSSWKHSLFLLLLLLSVSLTGCSNISIGDYEISIDFDSSDPSISPESRSEEPISNTLPSPNPSASFSVDILDVGQGLSVLIESDGSYLLFDGGDRENSSYVLSFLEEKGVETLDYVVASHYDADHISGLIGVINTFDVKQFLGPDQEKDTKTYQSLMRSLEEKSLSITLPSPGEKLSFGSATATILAPNSPSYKDANDYSIALCITSDVSEDNLLITGDAEFKSENEMLAAGFSLESTVYIAGHHGSASSSSWDFLQKVIPEYVVISCKAGNSYGHPHEESMEKFESLDAQILRTDTMGTIHADFTDSGIIWTPEPSKDYRSGDEIAQSDSEN